MSHLSSIGFPGATIEDLNSLIEKVYDRGKRIKVPMGVYIQFTDRSGAELFLQEDLNGKIIGINPHFQGKARMLVGLTNLLKRDGMDGAFHAWANPTDPTRPDTGSYPFVFDVPDFYSVEKTKLSFTTEAQISAFAHEVRLYDDKQEFNAEQDSKIKFASESFIPSGLFLPDRETTQPPQSEALLTGTILEFEEKVNAITQEKFYWFHVKTLGGEIDILSDPTLITKSPKVGGIIKGSFWLSGRFKNYQDSTPVVASIASFLVDDTGADTQTPLKEFLDPAKLDYSIESLKHVESYLDQIRKKIGTVTEEQLLKIIARCGAYCGEVIRKNAKKQYTWIDYHQAITIDPRVRSIGEESIFLSYILFAEPDDFSFPLAKVGKYIENGPEDSLYFFAMLILQEPVSIKKQPWKMSKTTRVIFIISLIFVLLVLLLGLLEEYAK